jgi:hypothetical protein
MKDASAWAVVWFFSHPGSSRLDNDVASMRLTGF